MDGAQQGSAAWWTRVYRIGGVAALMAGLLFRRNLAVEISMLGTTKPPETAEGWFLLLQSDPLLGLTYLHVFDLIDYVLVAMMFLALYAALARTNRPLMTIATSLALIGVAVYLASNPALPMLALSERYASAATSEQGALIASADQALAMGRFTGEGARAGVGGYISLLLIAVAGLMTSATMLQSRVFGRPTAVVGSIAAGLDLAYCAAYPFVAATHAELLALIFIPAAGLFLMAWHIMLGLRLLRL